MGYKEKWTEKEDEVIKKNYLDTGKDLWKLLPRRTPGAIRARAKTLGLGRRGGWTEKEMEILKRLYPAADKKRIRAMLPGRSFDSIRARAGKMGLARSAKPERKPAKKGFIKARPCTAVPLAEPKAGKATLKDDCGPYDPATHCTECAFYTLRGRREGRPASYCKCWHVKGMDGGYRAVRPGSPACRYFMGKRTLAIINAV